MTKVEYWIKVSSIMSNLNKQIEQLENESGRKFKTMEAQVPELPDRLGYKLVVKKTRMHDII
ncbi:hypothetical protein [Adhaeribacter radiodurans]|uniref:Uncharacterized protein n=1 Tax=Adhaeribacter radiodurans TaxID=2745197 RepID=A0A7L7L4E9_9BACT|nr:hypothetical protein [Adhaeribacter radiodurans]QMU27691.1 hypothetical protein HUW48_06355 [Adhaeribacter radiodurans]